jgi:hypothetical protein
MWTGDVIKPVTRKPRQNVSVSNAGENDDQMYIKKKIGEEGWIGRGTGKEHERSSQ